MTKFHKSRVLFFGKQDCAYSQKAYKYLKHLGHDVSVVLSRNRKENLPDDILHWEGDYIFCFRSYYVLSREFLDRAKVGAINFHPALTEYPGSGCLNWALYDKAENYGVTAHIMNEKVDNGPILECRRFPVLPQDDVTTLLDRAHQKTYDLLIDITTGLAIDGERFLKQKIHEFQHERWRGRARKMNEIDKLQLVDISISKEELERVIRATYTPAFQPLLYLHGHKFILSRD
jgi:methionyl-tRNA formyltransferase